jgi:hypothetical protein
MTLMMLAHREVQPAGRVHLQHHELCALAGRPRQRAPDVVRGGRSDGAVDAQHEDRRRGEAGEGALVWPARAITSAAASSHQTMCFITVCGAARPEEPTPAGQAAPTAVNSTINLLRFLVFEGGIVFGLE